MRFSVELLLEKEEFPKDKNPIIMHILKLLFQEKNKSKYQDMYEKIDNKSKNFTFSLYLGKNLEFLKESIIIPNKKIILNFTSSDIEETILFYNSFISNIGRIIKIKNNSIKINKINKLKDIDILENEILIKTMSPICIREHKNNNEKTWYHDISDKNGKKIFLANLKNQIKREFPNINEEYLKELDIDIVKNKLINIKHYKITIPSNIGIYILRGDCRILNFLEKEGIGSRRNQGFGMFLVLD